MISLLALPTSQLVLMILSFAGMFGFAGVAAWLWLRQRQAPPVARSTIAAPPKPNAATAPTARRPEPELPEVTEFIPLPGQREDDSPQPHPHASAGASPTGDEAGERTEFIAAPLERTTHSAKPVDDGAERTELMTPFRGAPEERTAFVAPPTDVELDERTSFIAPPPAPELDERTSFLAPPSFASAALAMPSAPPPSPVAAPNPERPAPRVAAELREHFDLAVAALTQLEQREDEHVATTLHGHIEVLASAPIEPLLELLRPTIEAPDPTGSRGHPAWLALLQHKSWPTRRALPELLAGLDERSRAEGMRSLASWNDPRAPGLAAAALEQAGAAIERRCEWLELFAERGWDPGDAAVDDALRSTDPRLLSVGLRLAGGRRPEQVRAQVSAQLFAADPAVRIEAVETALVFAEQSAWLVCRQLARNPAFARAAELVGLLGSEAEIAALCQAASVSNSESLLWGLGLSGRANALQVCAAALDDGELRSAARAALAIACGQELDSATAARDWLAKAPPDVRLIGGSVRTLDAIARTLADTDSLPLRRAIARELRIRAGGRVLLTPTLRPRAWRQQLDSLLDAGGRLDLDLDRDFPWHG